MPTTLVTGGAGFLGSHLCDLLLARGHQVLCVDNLLTGSRKNIAHIEDARFRFLEHDITLPLKVEGPLDFILHMACPASPVHYQKWPIETLKTGSLGTQNVLDLGIEKGARMLMASTSEVYGDPLVNPQPESYWGNVNPVGPRSMYDEAKRYAEALTMAYHRSRGADTVLVRIFNTYGPRMALDDGRAIPNFMTQALRGEALTVFGDGRQTRSFCFVSDLVEGIHRLLMSDVHEPVNLGNPQEITLMELAEKVLHVTGSRSKIVFKPLPGDDPRVRRPDISRARSLLDWRPTVDLETGLRETLDYFRRELDSPSSGS